MLVTFVVPNTYSPSTSLVLNINGVETTVNGTTISDKLNWGSSGTTETYNVCVVIEFGKAKIKKEISKIEITTPELVVGEKLNTDISKFQVKIDNSENLEITNIKWLSEDLTDLSIDTIEAGKKYRVQVNFNVPNKYGVSSNVIITVNGEQVHFEDMSSDEFNYATSGNLNYDYAVVTSNSIEVKNTADENKQENNTETKSGNDSKVTETTNNPKTGDTIVKVIFISVLSMIAVAYTINSIRKQNI